MGSKLTPNDNVFTLVPKEDEQKTNDKDEKITAEEVYHLSEEAQLKEVALVGIAKTGKVGFITNIDTVGDVLHLLELAKLHILRP